MLLFIQIVGATALGLLIAVVLIEYFEEILLASMVLAGMGFPMIWLISKFEGNSDFLMKIINVFQVAV